ncbi:MAG: fluoride efflux transporter CrcB [Bacteroidota bacterium]|nr:fluoride efflux transporter CrcB [Bacteroidota bacterium]
MKLNIILIAIGGALGSVLRYLTSLYVSRQFTVFSFPYGTFTVNVIGCFIIGVLYGLSERSQWLSQPGRLLLITGFCGGFTTFSAFAYENAKMLQQTHYAAFAVYTVLSCTLCIAMVFAGLSVTKWL